MLSKEVWCMYQRKSYDLPQQDHPHCVDLEPLTGGIIMVNELKEQCQKYNVWARTNVRSELHSNPRIQHVVMTQTYSTPDLTKRTYRNPISGLHLFALSV